MVWKNHEELFVKYKRNPILTAENLPYKAYSVFNPAAAIVDDITLYY